MGWPFSIGGCGVALLICLTLRAIVVKLKIIGAGFGRTGTHSLKSALDQIGFAPCHHMYEVRKRPEQVRLWLDVASGAPLDPDLAFAGFVSQVDWPASVFWRDLITHWPDAKVILTDRDPESWYDSMSRTIIPGTLLGRWKDADPVNRDASEMIYKLVLQGLLEGRYDDRAFCIERFLSNREEVIATVPTDRLFVFRTADGWGPLCKFLDVPVPDEPFPRTNSAAEFIARKPYMNS
jgi:hypothetical protein